MEYSEVDCHLFHEFAKIVFYVNFGINTILLLFH
jgi:hypothetical protein